MTVLDMSKTRDPGRRLVRETALRIADSIHNKSLRQHCIEQLSASETPDERRAALALAFELAQEDRRLLDSESFVHSILDSTSDCITITDLHGNIRFMNMPGQRAMEVEEFAPLHGQPLSNLWPASVEKALDKALSIARNGRNGHFSGYGPTSRGASKWWDASVAPIPGPDGAPARLLVIARDMTERRRSEQQLFQLEHYDSLTGLLNRNMLDRKLAQALTETNQKAQTAFLFLDLDEFKAVNDSLGHSVGDQVLVAVAERLKGQMCGSDIIARFGGDEFALVTRVSSVEQAENLAGRISTFLNEPYALHGREVNVGASIG
ncbi:diguanylate cyclase domain-containing protein, partial [Palleronia sp.]|uniref:diguanylate cyclase domain-containing protein n=1 Tax=Palleronia sp. TaxID=1940284 RepID=UPI0035C82C73